MTDNLNVDGRRGWVSAPHERGTMDIFWSCVSALVLCLYTMLHLNVPATEDRYWTVFWRKARWAFLGLVAPELPMLFACGQWASANRSLEAMHHHGYNDWTIEHAFYADSGGFVLQPRDGEAFPITAKQLKYVVQNKFIPLPKVTRREIWDKSNADHAAKFLTCFQSLWLVVQVVGRAIQGLPITPLELSTFAMVGCSLTTLWFWLKKPLDVETPTIPMMDHAIAEVVVGAGESAKGSFVDTPLDFIEPEVYMSRKWSRTAFRWIQALGLQSHPMERIPNDRDPQPSNLTQHVLLGMATAVFASIHLAGWNFGFPTYKELVLWRANCVVMWSLLAVYGTAEVVICWKEGYRNLGLDTLGAYKRRWPVCLWFFIPAFLYVCTRLVVIFESLWSMRSLPDGAFMTVDWLEFLSHI